MNLSISGKPINLTLKEVRYATKYWSKILLGSRLDKNVFLHLYFKPIAESGDIGYCSPIDHDRPNGAREFIIVVEKELKREEVLRVIAHELEHVRQFARGELRNEHCKLYYWKPSQAYYRETYKNHERLPWEKQAYYSEKWLLHFYEEHCKVHNVKF